MTDRLPTGLPVPPARRPVAVPTDGADQVVAAGRRLRRRRASAASLSATTLSVVVALLATAGSPGAARLDMTPASEPPSAPAAVERSTAAPALAPAPTGQPTAAPSGGRRSSPRQVTGIPRPTAVPDVTAGLLRREPMRPDTVRADMVACGGYAGRPCIRADAVSSVRSGGRIEIAVDVCVPDTAMSPLTVTFTTTKHADLALQLPRSDRDVWRWSAGQRFQPRRSKVVVEPGWCRRWLTHWDTRGADGRLVPRGEYEAVPWVEAPGVPVVHRTIEVV